MSTSRAGTTPRSRRTCFLIGPKRSTWRSTLRRSSGSGKEQVHGWSCMRPKNHDVVLFVKSNPSMHTCDTARFNATALDPFSPTGRCVVPLDVVQVWCSNRCRD